MLTLHRNERILVCIPLVLVVLLVTSCAPAATPTPTRLPPTEPVALATATQEAQIPGLAVSPTPYAEPKELPTKGSPEAKVTLTVFCEFG